MFAITGEILQTSFDLHEHRAILVVKLGIRNFVFMKKIRRAPAKQDAVPVPVGIMAKNRVNQQR